MSPAGVGQDVFFVEGVGRRGLRERDARDVGDDRGGDAGELE